MLLAPCGHATARSHQTSVALSGPFDKRPVASPGLLIGMLRLWRDDSMGGVVEATLPAALTACLSATSTCASVQVTWGSIRALTR